MKSCLRLLTFGMLTWEKYWAKIDGRRSGLTVVNAREKIVKTGMEIIPWLWGQLWWGMIYNGSDDVTTLLTTWHDC